MLFPLQMSLSLVCKLELNTGYADQKKDSLVTQLHSQGEFDIFQKQNILNLKSVELN